MTTKKQPTLPLNQIPADRRAIAELYAHGQIDAEAFNHALKVLYPKDQLGAWIARILLLLGFSLILTGVIYFFAFNWTRLSPMFKFSLIEAGIFGCLVGTFLFKVKNLSGKIFLLSASILVGVFLAVYGQVYQTGADAYQLFMGWSCIIAGWVVISDFVALWIVWLLLLNLFIGFYWDQATFPSSAMEEMIFFYLVILNGLFLFGREFVLQRGGVWLKARWLRAFLSFIVLGISFIPMATIVIESSVVTFSLIVSSALGLMLHIVIFLVYRYKFPDMQILAMVLFSGCVLAVIAAIRFLMHSFNDIRPGILLFFGVFTLAIFALAVLYLRKTHKVMEAQDDS